MLEQSRLRDFEARCTQESDPPCRASCPLDMDVRAFMAALAASHVAEARKLMERHLPLPTILCAICDHPCQSVCLRRDLGGSLAISDLERFCLAAIGPQTRPLPRPAKKQRLAVVGAGLAGLTAAFDISRKGFPVTVFDMDKTGPLLTAFSGISAETVHQEWANLEKNRVSFQALSNVDKDAIGQLLTELEQDYDAVFLDASRYELAPRRADISALTLHWRGKICVGGWLETTPTGARYASASKQAGDGRRAGITLQRIMTCVSLDAERESKGSKLHVSLKGIEPEPQVLPGERGYTESEAVREAARCIQCSCLQCVRECVYLQKYKEFPRLYARKLFSNATVVKGTRTAANVVMNGCAMCGQCEVICPEGFSMSQLCLEVRRDAVARDVMPDSAHAFALEDMEQASSAESAFFMEDPSLAQGAHAPEVFFPGCQLAGSRPTQVLAIYEWLRKALPGGISLFSDCCGIPAQWAGREAVFEAHAANLRKQWNSFGKPRIIAACSSCMNTLALALPGAEITSLWEKLDDLMPGAFRYADRPAFPDEMTVQDPCGARHNEAWQKAVRSLAAKAGIQTTEPEHSGESTACCGYGGLVWNAQPELAEAMTRQRGQNLGSQTLTSCIMCHNRFAAMSKSQSWYLLDILPQTASLQAQAGDNGLSGRRAGRAALREAAMGSGFNAPAAEDKFVLHISRQLLESMERQFILRQDVEQAVRGIESSGKKFRDSQSGHFLGSWRPRLVTFWVEYSADPDGAFTLLGAWSHRMVVPGAIQPANEVKLRQRIRA